VRKSENFWAFFERMSTGVHGPFRAVARGQYAVRIPTHRHRRVGSVVGMAFCISGSRSTFRGPRPTVHGPRFSGALSTMTWGDSAQGQTRQAGKSARSSRAEHPACVIWRWSSRALLLLAMHLQTDELTKTHGRSLRTGNRLFQVWCNLRRDSPPSRKNRGPVESIPRATRRSVGSEGLGSELCSACAIPVSSCHCPAWKSVNSPESANTPCQ
jgi:hypothetical protein